MATTDTDLDKVKLGDLVREIVNTDLVIFNDTGDLELLDSVTNGDKRACSPDKTIHLNADDGIGKGVHVNRIIIPGDHVKNNHRLVTVNKGWIASH